MTRTDAIRKEILFQLFACRPVPLTASTIHKSCRKERLDFSETEIKREFVFLHDDGLIKPEAERGSAEEPYRITAEGVRVYETKYA
ncbi:MAG: hypothetical protein SFY81_04890 [Verrucomicrobiota bacterium]|nr:hypothetical protein [Verrucomicrobiota bacterium]